MAYLGLDIGTSAVKGVLVDGEQQCLASASRAYGVDHPRPGFAEQSPDVWWQAVEEVVVDLRRQSPEGVSRVAAIGLSGQMHGLVLQDEAGRIVRPAILWNDQRADRECRRLEERLPEFGQLTGVSPMPAFWAAKLLWLAAHERDSLASARHLLLPKDHVRWRLSGEHVTDMCDAAGTQLLDQAQRDWSDAVLACCGITRDVLPRLVEGTQHAGWLDERLASRWGIPSAVRIAGGAGDVAAGALGIGAIHEGSAFLTLGTSSQMFVTADGYRPAPESVLHAFAHALPGRWFQMAAMLNGASALSWVAELLGLSIETALSKAERAARDSGEGEHSEGLLFLPYLNGERTPHDDPHARGVLFGLTPASQPGDVVLAVLDGVGYSLREARDVIESAGTPIERLAVIGGGSRSDFWLRRLADIIDRPLVRYRDSERGPAFGAARLARMASTGEPAEHVCTPPEVDTVFEPRPERSARHAAQFERFKALYRALRPEFKRAGSSL
ncbi:xylulokinase [Halomonas urumqiensis]|nr:xylulokinase [Halomonas urumqiensis]